jgi:predicted ATPase
MSTKASSRRCPHHSGWRSRWRCSEPCRPARPPEPLAIALGLLNVLRALAGLGPLLVAVDDLQRQDSASTEALAFAARRLDGEAVSILLARRPGIPSDLERVLERREPERLHVGPLGLTATGRLLLERLGLNVRRQLLRRIVEATRGNPFFALELGRTLVARGPPATGRRYRCPTLVPPGPAAPTPSSRRHGA